MNENQLPAIRTALKNSVETDTFLIDKHFKKNKAFIMGLIFFATLFFAAQLYILLRYVYDAGEIAESIETSARQTIQAVPTAKPAQPASTTADEMEGWKTYRNEEYGFEFKYPPTLTQDLSEGVTVNYGKMFKTVFSSKNQGLQLIIWTALTTNDLHNGIGLGDMKQTSTSTIEVASYQADMEIWETNTTNPEYYKAGDDISVFYSVSLKDKPLDIWYIADDKNQVSSNDFSQILSTFEFVGE